MTTTKNKSHLSTLKNAKRIVDAYRKTLSRVEYNEFPSSWDSVVVNEVLSGLAHELHTFDRDADIPALNFKGIASTPAFIGSFWPSVEMLLELMPEPIATRHFLDAASRLLTKDIKDNE